MPGPICSNRFKESLKNQFAPILQSLKIMYFNARSVVNKIHLIYSFLLNNSNAFDLIFITETWLTSNILDSMICPAGYNILRHDRFGARGGGVLVIYKSCLMVNKFVPSNHEIDDSQCFEYVTIDVLCAKKQKIRVSCFYVPPSTSASLESLKTVCKYLSECSVTSHSYILGDFNLPRIDWTIPASLGGPCHDYFLECCQNASLTQRILEPTHLSGNTLDLLLCSDPSFQFVESFCVSAPFSATCDHSSLNLKLTFPVEKQKERATARPNFKTADYCEISSHLLSIDWNHIIEANSNDIQQLYDHFVNVISQTIDCFVPKYKRHQHRRKPIHIKKLLKEKQKLYQLSKMNSVMNLKYKQTAKDYDNAVKCWHDSIESSICNNANKSRFYGYVNSKLKSSTQIPPLNTPNGIAESDAEKADSLNTFFHSVFTSDNGFDLELVPHLNFSQFMKDIEVSEEDILMAIHNLADKLSYTPDGIPSYFLKRIVCAILPFLTHLFNISLSLATVPSQWRSAIVIPIFKKGSRNLVSNYRPISLTCCLCRVLETIISQKFLDHLYRYNLISPFQFGFIPGKSSCSQLLSAINHFLTAYDQNKTVDIIYTDIAKAFDSVSHKKLLSVLQSYGVNGNAFNWIQAFLDQRKQQVRVQDSFSCFKPVSSGVPQGSVIGPLLFIIYINDLIQAATATENDSNCAMFLFADDAKLISCDNFALQNAIHKVYTWMNVRQLRLAPTKFEHLPLNRNSSDNHTFTIEDTEICSSNYVKDLGVYVSNDMKWSKHISYVRSKASATAYQILHSFSSKNVWTLLKAYVTYVRPLLEYNTPVWSPYLQKNIHAIESVQKRYTKTICMRCNIPFTSYSDRLHKLNIQSLQYRRLEYDLILTYKICYGLIDINFDNFFKYCSSPYKLRRHRLTLQSIGKPKHKNVTNFFSHRVVSLWNSLPEYVVTAPSLPIFKNYLKKFDLCSITTIIY